MKAELHPDYHKVRVTCACGESFETMSTHSGEEVRVDICSKCHPFYTGKRKIIDSSGRVDRFRKKYNLD